MSRKTLVFGVSGLIGSSLVPLLAQEFDEIIAPVRRLHGNSHDRLQTPVIDFETLPQNAALFKNIEVLFYCLGSTRKRAGSYEKFRSIEWKLANQVLGSAKQYGVPKVVMISAKGANENSLFGYNRVKGEVERYAKNLQFDNLIIARPSLLMGERSEIRMIEGLSISLFKPILKPLQKFSPNMAPIQDYELAKALVVASKTCRKPMTILENEDLLRLNSN